MAPIEMQDLTKRYGDIVAVEGLDLEIHRGEVTGLLGPNGAGKSTTIKMLVGLVSPTRGRAWIGGHDARGEGVAARQRLGYLPEIVGLYEEMSARQFLRYSGRFYNLSASEVTRRADRLLARVRLEHAADRRIGTFSKGMRQRLALAGALLHDPDVLVLDEPLTGLDPEGVVKMKRAIEQLGEERTVFLSSHELHAVESLCDRAIILKNGRVLADAPVEELTRRDPPWFALRLARPDPGRDRVDALLSGIEGIRKVARADGSGVYRITADDEAAIADGVARLVGAGLSVVEVAREDRTLEEAFVDLAGVRA